jgi:RES domain-containing protein
VYCAPDPAAALLEVLVHLEIDTEDIPVKLQYLEILIPDPVKVARLAAGAWRKGWEKRVAITRAYGDKWLKDGRTAVLQVPSVVVPETWNVLINPVHAESEGVRVQRMFRQGLDTWLGRGE